MTFVSDSTRRSLLDRSGHRCECHNPACRHHRAGSRCPRGLRGEGWHVFVREKGAGERLWNLLAICTACLAASGGEE